MRFISPDYGISHVIKAPKPNHIVIDKENIKCQIIVFDVSSDRRGDSKEIIITMSFEEFVSLAILGLENYVQNKK